MKGKFKYNNKTFKWQLKIKTYANDNTRGYIEIYYHKPWSILAEVIEYENYCFYEQTVEKYNQKSYEEIEAIVRYAIIKDYEFKQKEKKFK